MKSILLELDEYLMEQQTNLARKAYAMGGPHLEDTNPNMVKLELFLEISSKVSKLCKQNMGFGTGAFNAKKLFIIKADNTYYGTYEAEEEAKDRAEHLKTKHASIEVQPVAAELLPDDRVIVNKMVFWGQFSVKNGLLFCNDSQEAFAENEAYKDNLDSYDNPYSLRGE